jgi:2-polyprenyl-6-methoxyphenol hydroxylase-like FAD-dependent oxidoreductase
MVWGIIDLPSVAALGFRKGVGNVAMRPASKLSAGDLLDVATTRSDAAKPMNKKGKTAVIVGGGPCGLATALVLSKVKKPGSKDPDGPFFKRIIVLEERPKENFDVARAYTFNVNKRGQRFTDAFGIDLSKYGAPIKHFQQQRVPSDPNVVFDGESPREQAQTDEERQRMGTSYQITRPELLELIKDEIRSRNENDNNAIIEIRKDSRCKHIEPTEDGLVNVVLTEEEGTENSIVADFCVGADGVSSIVRRSLEDGRFDPERWSNAKNPSKRFGLKQYATPATGLRLKGLVINQDFAIPKGGSGPDSTSEIPLDSRFIMYRLESATKGTTDSLPLSIFAVKDPRRLSGRIVQICTEPSHDIWNEEKIPTDDGGRSIKAYFEKAHPRYDWDKMVAEDEWEKFASTRGLRFPLCQYAPSMYVSSNSNENDENDGAGVVLVGDALHAFPPDLGQGVNVALCDVMMLGKSFEKAAAAPKSTNSFVSEALKSYQDENGPETRALISLARVGGPFQYDQSSTKARFLKKLWIANFVLRLLLNKVTFGLSPKPAVLTMFSVCETSRCCSRSTFVRAHMHFTPSLAHSLSRSSTFLNF